MSLGSPKGFSLGGGWSRDEFIRPVGAQARRSIMPPELRGPHPPSPPTPVHTIRRENRVPGECCFLGGGGECGLTRECGSAPGCVFYPGSSARVAAVQAVRCVRCGPCRLLCWGGGTLWGYPYHHRGGPNQPGGARARHSLMPPELRGPHPPSPPVPVRQQEQTTKVRSSFVFEGSQDKD